MMGDGLRHGREKTINSISMMGMDFLWWWDGVIYDWGWRTRVRHGWGVLLLQGGLLIGRKSE